MKTINDNPAILSHVSLLIAIKHLALYCLQVHALAISVPQLLFLLHIYLVCFLISSGSLNTSSHTKAKRLLVFVVLTLVSKPYQVVVRETQSSPNTKVLAATLSRNSLLKNTFFTPSNLPTCQYHISVSHLVRRKNVK